LNQTDLEEMSQRMYPDSLTMQQKWEQAVRYLRNGRGWCAEGAVGFALPTAPPPMEPKHSDRVVPVIEFKARGRK